MIPDAHAPAQPSGERRALLGISGRLLVLTAAFVMLAEVLIYVPSVANFRRTWLSDRIAGAQMVALVLDAAPSPPAGQLNRNIEGRLLEGIMARAIAVRGQGTEWLIANGGPAPTVDATFDLRDAPWHVLIRDALRTLVWPVEHPIRVIGQGVGNVGFVELILDERPLRQAMLMFSRNILFLSLIISLITAGLVYLALHAMIVRPVRRLTGNIADFAANPEDTRRIIAPSRRRDEIGIAERALARMEERLADELRQKRRLADLGLAVSKINHELRNMLTTAQLLSDRLGEFEEPAAQRIVPRLMATLGRAIEFCETTLAYGRARERAPQRKRVRLAPLVAEQIDVARLVSNGQIALDVDIPADLEVDADPEQLARILTNLLRNAVQALSASGTAKGLPRIGIRARRTGREVAIVVADDGPGIPADRRDLLFAAFQGSRNSGGTGLGLPVADELARLHGGAVTLQDVPVGATFRITIPDRAA